jgi:hypothetical protein
MMRLGILVLSAYPRQLDKADKLDALRSERTLKEVVHAIYLTADNPRGPTKS